MTRRRAAAILFVVLASCSSFRLFEAQDQDTLYFGTARVNAPAVSDTEWRAFVEHEIVPAFPGFSEIEGYGYWKGVGEPGHIVIIVHPRSGDANGHIQHIIDAYKRQFQQEAVFWTKASVDVPMD